MSNFKFWRKSAMRNNAAPGETGTSPENRDDLINSSPEYLSDSGFHRYVTFPSPGLGPISVDENTKPTSGS